MKKIIFLLFFLTGFLQAGAQVLEPAKWKTRIEKLSGNEATLVIEGTIDEGWHVYSQFTPDGGPLPIVLEFKDAKGNFELVGKATESQTKRQFNDVFGVDEIYFEKKAVLKQKIKLLNAKLSKIEANFEWQVCKESCINDKKKLSFDIPVQNAAAAIPEAAVAMPGSQSVDTVIAPAAAIKQETKAADKKAALTTNNPKATESLSLLTIFLLAFGAGFGALLTPCVFPMIPMTVSFFTKQSKTKAKGIRNAITYGISIIVIYVILGSVITAVFGADALHALSTNVWFNLVFFVLLVIFATSFLGAFEIVLPNSWANKVDRQADRGGIVGILFMALALAIVSFSCTGIFVGNILVLAASQGGISPIVGMFGFSLALALPFMLFALFPSWLNSLPKSGGWLNTVKVFLGFVELALAFKFLSNADLVLQMHLLEREVFLAIWIAIFGTLSLYLLGKITTPHDGPQHSISVGRLLLALVTLSFTIYMIPGLWGAPLKLINAFPPPVEYSESPRGFGNTGSAAPTAQLPEGAEYGPNDIPVFHDYDKGVAYAKSVKKPVMLDFTGLACVNCRKMENSAWVDARVLPMLKNDVVVISLYVDDAKDLPENEKTVSKSGRDIETYGDKWTDFMITKYNTNTQPLYVLTDTDGNSLNTADPTSGYVGTDVFLKWLQTGISNFKK